jgi:hypothetical protein
MAGVGAYPLLLCIGMAATGVCLRRMTKAKITKPAIPIQT